MRKSVSEVRCDVLNWKCIHSITVTTSTHGSLSVVNDVSHASGVAPQMAPVSGSVCCQ